MALLQCPDCGKPVSESAAACPECGRPNTRPAPPKKSRLRGCLGGFVLIVLSLSLLGKLTSLHDSDGWERGTARELQKIQVATKPSGQFEPDGKQGVLVVVTNHSSRTFRGSITIQGEDQNGKILDWEALQVGPLSGDGGVERDRIVLQRTLEMDHLSYEIRDGEFSTALTPPRPASFEEEVGKREGRDFFVYTPAKDSASLWAIAQWYKAKYSASPIIAVAFFHDKKKAAHQFPMNDAAMSVLSGVYRINRTTEFEELHMGH